MESEGTGHRDGDLPRPFGAYRLLRELGGGAYGTVYEAEQERPRRKVAIKILHGRLDRNASARERFFREAEAAAKIRHAHVVPIYESGEADGKAYFTMPLLEGRDLADAIRDGSLGTPEDICRRAAEVAEALGELHDAGVVHRDIKPSNILVDEDGRWMLADFGLARTAAAETVTMSGESMGTPLYMSPEQLLGSRSQVNTTSDVYALGATLYEVLTGKPPFTTGDLNALYRSILKDVPPKPRTLREDLPPACEQILLKCLEKRQDDRYATAQDLAADLKRAVAGEPVHGRPISAPKKALRALREHPLPVVAGLVLLLGLLGWWWVASHAPATLQITAVSGSSVSLNGAEFVPVLPGEVGPIVDHMLEVPPGLLRMRFRRERFEDWGDEHEVEPGTRYPLEVPFRPAVAGDPEALRLIEEMTAAKIPLGELETSTRGGAAGAVELLFPAGAVRVDDLHNYRIEVSRAFAPNGHRVVWRRGEAVLHESAFEPEDFVTAGPVPQAVRGAADVGDEITWSVENDEGTDVRAAISVVGEPTTDEWRQAQKFLASYSEVEDPTLYALLSSRVLLAAGLPTAAYHAAEKGMASSPVDLLLAERRLLALQEMHPGFDARERLHGTRLWVELDTIRLGR